MPTTGQQKQSKTATLFSVTDVKGLTRSSLTAASELGFSRPGSATADNRVQDTALSYPPGNSKNVAGNFNHLEILS